MRNDKRLPDAELEVMQTIWSLGTQVTACLLYTSRCV